MVQRNLDPCFFGVIRDGNLCKICFSDLTLEERKLVLSKFNKNDLITLSNKLADALNFVGDYYNITFEEIS